jgi:hypothetical protein
MAKVLVDLPKHSLSKEQRGAGFEVFEPNGGAKIGDLIVSQGGLRWYPRGTRNARYVSWKHFDQLMSDHGKQEKG